MPPLLAAIPFLGKAIGGAKALVGLGGAAKAATGVGSAMKAGAALPGVLGSAGSRMAGGKLAGLGSKIMGGLKGAIPRTMDDAALMLGPDVLFGGLAGAMTPGDLGDKLIAGTTDAVLGAGLTGGLRGALGARPGSALSNTIEMAGGYGAGMASYPVAEQLLRIKGGGQSPYDKLQTEQYAAMEQQIKDDLYAQVMGGNRTPYVQDPFLSENGLA